MGKNQVVAIDIGTNTAKMVQLELSSTGVHLINANVVTYSDGADRQQAVDSVAQLWKSLDNRLTQHNFLSLFSRNRTEIAVALPRFLVSTKRLGNLPDATDQQLAGIVALAAETELPFRVDEAIFTYHDVQRISDGVSVELISTRRSTVTDYLHFLEQIGVSASAVIPSTIAIAEVAARSACTQPTFIVDIGTEHADFCFIQDGVLRFSRSFRLSAQPSSERQNHAPNIDAGAVQEQQHVSTTEPLASEWTAHLISELRRSIAASKIYSETDDLGRPENVGGTEALTPSEIEAELWLCGSGSRLPELTTACETDLGRITRLWNPVDALEHSEGIDMHLASAQVKAALDEWGDTLAVPLGVALNAVNPATKVSLLPKEAVEMLTQSTRQRQLFASAGLGALIICGGLFSSYTLHRTQQHKSDAVNRQLAYYAQPMASAKVQLSRELAITDMLAHHISPLDILHVLSEMFRDRTQVAWTNFNITNLNVPENARITFNLESSSHNAINSLLATLNRSQVFTNVQAGEVTTAAQSGRQAFQVQVRCNLTASAVRAFAKKRYPPPELSADEIQTEPESNDNQPASTDEMQTEPESNDNQPASETDENRDNEKDE